MQVFQREILAGRAGEVRMNAEISQKLHVARSGSRGSEALLATLRARCGKNHTAASIAHMTYSFANDIELL